MVAFAVMLMDSTEDPVWMEIWKYSEKNDPRFMLNLLPPFKVDWKVLVVKLESSDVCISTVDEDFSKRKCDLEL